MHMLNIVRYSVHGAMIAFSLILLGLMANFISLLNGFSFSTFNFGIVVSLFTMIFIGVTHVLAHVNPSAPTNMIFVELIWTGLLWIFWVALAGSLSSLGILSRCDLLRGEAESQCRQYQASQAFAWLGWLAIMGWFCTLLTFTIIAHTRGNGRIWFESTKDVPFFNSKSLNDKYNMNSAPTGNSNFAPQSMNSQASFNYQNYPTMQSNGTGAYPSQPQQFNNV